MSVSTAADTVLCVDFGTANTRALLFDVVEAGYRFVGYGEAPSTINAPYRDASEGLHHALETLQRITGRQVLDDHAHLIVPATSDGRGVDGFVATSSAGPAVRAVLVGLLPDVSLASARRIAASSYINVLDTFSLGDVRGEDEQIDAVIAARPELLIIAGGSDGGATRALLKLVETVSLACHLLPPGIHPRALFVGNTDLQTRMSELLGRVSAVHLAPNVQPALGREQLGPARAELGRTFEEIRLEQVGGFASVSQWAGGHIFPTAQAQGTYARFLSRLPAWSRGVLSVDAGSASTSIAAAWNGDLRLNVQTNLGLGTGAAAALADTPIDQMTRWLPSAVSDDAFREFVLNKAAHPSSVPADPGELWLEMALARQVIRQAARRARPDWPAEAPAFRPEFLPWFSLIIGGGAVLGRAPRPGLAALVLLDALQPCGVTRLMIDPYHLQAALGAAAATHPLLAAQVHDSLPLLDLGTSVSLIGRARLGDPAVSVKLVPDAADGDGANASQSAESQTDVPFGSLALLALAPGRTGKLSIRPRAGFNAGFGAGRGRTVTVQGGVLGVIIDARGRPVALPRAAEQRQDLVKQWTWRMGGG
jgi:hypothetical protein